MAAARLFLLFSMVSGLFFLALTPSQAEDDEDDPQLEARIRTGIQRGVAYLRQTQQEGWWKHNAAADTESNVGATALCALALVFAGVDVNDAAVENAVEIVRSHAPQINFTYSLSLSLILLDRVNKGQHTALIRQLGQRLLTGQVARGGGWGYYSPARTEAQDNSNTQLAMVALYLAHNHGVNVQAAFKAAEKRFRESQLQLGGWSYLAHGHGEHGTPTMAMTCSGLLALACSFKLQRNAVFQGANADADTLDPERAAEIARLVNPRSDPQVRRAAEFLRSIMPEAGSGGGPHFAYGLWTMERTCLVYGWKKVQGVNWFYWGARRLLPLQQNNGSWTGDQISGPNAETAFAVLFLCKADILGEIDFTTFSGGNLGALHKKAKQAPPKPRVKQPKAEPGREGRAGEATALREELRTAEAERIEEILDLLEKTKGTEYTTALHDALSLLKEEIKPMARSALARRFGRLKATSLRGYLQHAEVEYRRAAAQAAGMKNDKELLPDLIQLLRDPATEVTDETYQALKKITGQDFGKSVRSWDRWWQEQNK